VNEEILNPAKQFAPLPHGEAQLSKFSVFLSDVLDSFSYFFFCLSFSGLTHVLGSIWNRFLAEE